MTTIPNIGSDHFDGQTNLGRGGRVGDEMILANFIRASRTDMISVEERLDLLETLNPTDTKTVYVAQGATALDADGSVLRPYSDLQDAIDAVEADNPSGYNTVMVLPGIYTGPFEVHSNTSVVGVSGVGHGADVVITAAAGEVPLTYTNATSASLAAYRSSGIYSDLVNQGDAGPQDFAIANLVVFEAGYGLGIELLGVKGDATVNTTDFCGYSGGPRAWGGFIENVYIYGVFSVKNANYITINNSLMYGLNSYNSAVLFVSNSQFYTSFTLEQDAASGDGAPVAALKDASILYAMLVDPTLTDCGVYFIQCCVNGTVFTMDDASSAVVKGGVIGCAVDLNGTADLTAYNVNIIDDVVAEGGVTATLFDVSILGDVTLANPGAGAWSWTGGIRAGTLTDVGGRLTRVVADAP